MPKDRKHWIDSMRGMCMLAILLDHTEIYYTGTNIIDYNMYVTDALYLFFFISGYLLYRENGEMDLRKRTVGILRTLVMPYFIFTTAMALPKAIAHHNNINLGNTAIEIITGQASWFIAALIIAEFLFMATAKVCKGNAWLMACVGGIATMGAIMLSTTDCGHFWQTDIALLAMPMLTLGFVYHKYEDSWRTDTRTAILAAIAVIATKVYVANTDTILMIRPINISNYDLFAINVVTGCWAMTCIFKRIPKCKPLEWIGRHTIVYYFLCGGVPLTISSLSNRMGFAYDGNYIKVVIVYASVCAVATLLTFAIYKYMPFVTGRPKQP